MESRTGSAGSSRCRCTAPGTDPADRAAGPQPGELSRSAPGRDRGHARRPGVQPRALVRSRDASALRADPAGQGPRETGSSTTRPAGCSDIPKDCIILEGPCARASAAPAAGSVPARSPLLARGVARRAGRRGPEQSAPERRSVNGVGEVHPARCAGPRAPRSAVARACSAAAAGRLRSADRARAWRSLVEARGGTSSAARLARVQPAPERGPVDPDRVCPGSVASRSSRWMIGPISASSALSSQSVRSEGRTRPDRSSISRR